MDKTPYIELKTLVDGIKKDDLPFDICKKLVKFYKKHEKLLNKVE